MEDNRTEAAKAVDNYQERELKEVREIAKTHVTYTMFAWTASIFTLIMFSFAGYATSRMSKIEDTHEARFRQIEEKISVSNVEYAKIQTTLVQIQISLNEIKNDLKDHSK